MIKYFHQQAMSSQTIPTCNQRLGGRIFPLFFTGRCGLRLGNGGPFFRGPLRNFFTLPLLAVPYVLLLFLHIFLFIPLHRNSNLARFSQPVLAKRFSTSSVPVRAVLLLRLVVGRDQRFFRSPLASNVPIRRRMPESTGMQPLPSNR
ncbi:hypothetical protein CDAR_97621 [Caerostris darwini]|uniref:Transmembrane protein n=1 Tax=Caerostris darwini TaxID=1538125 RepID=A0AAV4NJ49_9ARAC|nr:hypothetical protein CDAR_97621 [Caerostris darwini]